MIMRREILPLSIFLAFAVLPLLGNFGSDAFILSIVTRVMIFAIAAVSLDLILGYGALVSFGHAAFLGIGAYAVGILSAHGIREAAIQIPAALIVSALFALLTGAISLRTKGIYFIMITLAFGQMAYFFAVSLAAYGGDDDERRLTKSMDEPPLCLHAWQISFTHPASGESVAFTAPPPDWAHHDRQ